MNFIQEEKLRYIEEHLANLKEVLEDTEEWSTFRLSLVSEECLHMSKYISDIYDMSESCFRRMQYEIIGQLESKEVKE